MSNTKKTSQSKIQSGEVTFFGPGSTLEKLKEFKPKSYNKLKFTYVPDKASQISANFNTNSLSTIPPEIFQNEQLIENLTEVDLSNNKIKKIPGGFGACLALENANFSGNLIKTLPGPVIKKLENLVVLKVGHNLIKSLPRVLNKCDSLKVADFRGRCFSFEYFFERRNILIFSKVTRVIKEMSIS